VISIVFTTCLLLYTELASLAAISLLALPRLRPTVKALEKPGLLIPSEYATSLRRNIFEKGMSSARLVFEIRIVFFEFHHGFFRPVPAV
jgi:hypothetical protein